MKGEQTGTKLEEYVSFSVHFLMVKRMIVFPIKENMTYLCRDRLGEFVFHRMCVMCVLGNLGSQPCERR